MGVPKSGVARGGRWQLAPCLIAAEAEANRLAPRRSKASDGSIGDAAHAERTSDHNPDEEGRLDWVDALDLTHDPKGGFDAHAHARNIAARRDPRISYIISNWRIWDHERGWRRYNGTNGHTHHIHLSIDDGHRTDTSPWFGAKIVLPTVPIVHQDPTPDAPPKEHDMHSIVITEDVAIVHVIPGALACPITLNELVMQRLNYEKEGQPLIEMHKSPAQFRTMFPHLAALAAGK